MQLSFPKSIVLALALLIPVVGHAQTIKGRITNTQNEPVPFAVVYDETSLTGTNSNSEGYYELKLDPGSHTIQFKAMGYHLVRHSINLSEKTINHDVRLTEQPLEVKAVVIRPGKEDPAYGIMRKVIALAPYHLSQVKHYEADVYLRGTAHIVKMPKYLSKMMAVDGESVAFKSGDAFMEESLNRITFNAPDSFEQKVLSIRSTMPWDGDEISPMGMINASLYEPKVLEFISPLAPNAFQFYNYKYEGFFDEGGKAVFKINVIPKRNSQQLMRGTVFIVDQLWCLHSADVSVNMFFGSLNFKTIYSNVKSDAWLPVSYQFYFDASIVGVKANFKYAGSVKYAEVVLNEKTQVKPAELGQAVKKTQTVSSEKKTKNQQKLEELMAKEDLSNRDVMKIATLMAKESRGDTVKEKSLEIKDEDKGSRNVIVEKDAVRNDTTFWNEIRPIPLTEIESKIAPVKEVKVAESRKDSIVVSAGTGKLRNKTAGKIVGFITDGYGFSLFNSATNVRYEGVIGFKKIDFNTADGFIYRQTVAIRQKVDSGRYLNINPGVAYAFNRERFMWWTTMNYEYAPLRRGNIRFYIGSRSADYNSESGINSNLNSIASLVFRRNYLKVYHQNQAFLENRIDLANGLNLSVQTGYRTAMPLSNHSDYSFFYRNKREYTSNVPGNNADVAGKNVYNEEAYWDARLEFTPKHYYRIERGRKVYNYSLYPTFFIRNRMAIPGIVKSTADYNYLEAGIRQQIKWEMMHAFSWNIRGGIFLNRDKIYAMDYRYLNNQDLPVVFNNAKESFRLLPFYRYAVNDKYAEAHVQFTAPYILFKYLPFISNKLWVENLHLNYLAGGGGLHYWEAGYSMGQIYFIGSIGVFAGFDKDKFKRWGIQVSFDL